jgi:hypothetical protein
MPGLDPGIHFLSEKIFSKRMNCRVKPGNDDPDPTDSAFRYELMRFFL